MDLTAEAITLIELPPTVPGFDFDESELPAGCDLEASCQNFDKLTAANLRTWFPNATVNFTSPYSLKLYDKDGVIESLAADSMVDQISEVIMDIYNAQQFWAAND
jgi:hypothetical protein